MLLGQSAQLHHKVGTRAAMVESEPVERLIWLMWLTGKPHAANGINVSAMGVPPQVSSANALA